MDMDSNLSNDALEKQRLIDLIEFAQQTAKLKLRPVKQISEYDLFYRYEHQLKHLPGIKYNVGGENDEIWFVVERLWESKPDEPEDQHLQLWLDGSTKPEIEPSIKKTVELKKLYEAKILTLEDKNEQNENKLILFADYVHHEHVTNQFHHYLEFKWKPWALEEQKRRSTIKFYSELFTLKQQLEGAINDTQIEVVLGLGIALWKTEEYSINHPLLTQSVEISLNQKNQSIEIRPTQVDLHYELELFASFDNPGVMELERIFKDFKEKQTQSFSPYDPISYESLLRQAITHLDAKGVFLPEKINPEDRSLPKADEKLTVTDTWVLLARPRSKSLFIQDLDNFKNKLESDAATNSKDQFILSSVVKAIVSKPSAEHKTRQLKSYRGISSFENMQNSTKDAEDLFFPLPFNDEQVNIIRSLESADGVVVQGPPGTGKTHTIANIISHYMANGKRVLVTSMKEPALTVLKDKLPEMLRPLAISLLASEQDGIKQFEFAVSKIAQELNRIDRNSLTREIKAEELSIDQLHAQLALTDCRINDWAKKNMETFLFDGTQIYPEVAAREIAKFSGQYEWLEDAISIQDEYEPKFNNEDIIRLREARRKIGKNLDHLDANLPEMSNLPDFIQTLEIHRELTKNNKLKEISEKENIPPLVDNSDKVIADVTMLITAVTDLCQIKLTLKNLNKSWIEVINHQLKKNESITLVDILEKIILEFDAVNSERNIFIERPVYFPEGFILIEETTKAIANKAQGKSAFGIAGILGKSSIKKQVDMIRILNQPVKTLEDWQHVYQFVLSELRISELILRWNTISAEMSLLIINETSSENGFRILKENIEIYKLVKRHNNLENFILKISKITYPTWPHHHEMVDNFERLEEFRNILEHHYNYYKSFQSWSAKEKAINSIIEFNGRISNSISIFLKEKVGSTLITDMELQIAWTSLVDELRSLHALRTNFADIIEITSRIMNSGGTLWAMKLCKEPMLETVDRLLPDNWSDAWRLKRLVNYINSITSVNEFKNLMFQRNEFEQQLVKIYPLVAAKRTWLKLSENATPDIKAALQSFVAAIMKIGKGTGKRAVRYRRDAKESASKVNKAVPCWIMPHYRVSESLPPEFECFDLVIIDEASQSDLTALPAILRAKKLLIVGDDKQVSPEGVGLEEEKINQLMLRYLSKQIDVFRSLMTPERSIYDLFKVVFADTQIMLREHFRCVEPIIEYSKREFYDHELKPIRIPKKSERLDPPLIDVVIEDGFRDKKINLPEAKFIVQEIKKICDDPSLEEHTIGVVSLLGDEQAHKVWEMLEKELSFEEITKHKITCGDARVFQGKERNIMFLSMVATKDNCTAIARDTFKQRFNVATSRSQDRMYLVRSIELDDLSNADILRQSLIKHFSSPFAQDEVQVENLRELCESEFEREIYDILTERGYKVTPQVKVGAYRIDMVVEGEQDARLAIECDGDRYHPPEKWEEDMNRQRILERVGWRFWRCFASAFVLNREEIVSELIKILADKGINPIGANTSFRSIHTELRRVKMLAECIFE